MKPRRRYLVSVCTGLAFLFTLGSLSHYFAARSQRSSLVRRLDSFDGRLSALEKSFSSLQESCADGRPLAVGNEPQSGESVGGSPSTYVPRPRWLGTGRSGSYFYADVAYPDGYTARYYLRTNATPAQVAAYVDGLSADARSHSVLSQ